MDDVEAATIQWDRHDPQMVLCHEKIEVQGVVKASWTQ